MGEINCLVDILKMKIMQQREGINFVPSQQEERKTLIYHDAMQAEFEDFIKTLDENADPTILVLKENLIAAFNYGEQTEINLRTQNGESALSIAAQHGFSNVVQFLIS